jgi:hypothetical protein
LVAAVWRGEFDISDGSSHVFTSETPTHKGKGEDETPTCGFARSDDAVYMYTVESTDEEEERLEFTREREEVTWTRADLLRAMCWDDRLPPELHTYEYLERRPIDDYGEVARSFIERLMIRRASLADWCIRKRVSVPAFLRCGTAEPSSAKRPPSRARKRNEVKEIQLENRIRGILLVAQQRWRHPTRRPTIRQMARLLAQDKKASAGFSEDSIRKILSGQYPPARRLGIPPLTG